MARMIYQKDSTAMHVKMARRHMRLCGQVKGAGKFAEQIQPAWSKLREKQNEKAAASDARDDAYDDVILKDSELDNAVRTTFERIRQYDRENTTRYLELMFPSHGFSGIVYSPLSKEPQEVQNVVLKLESLDEGHALRELIEPLKTAAETSAAAVKTYEDCGRLMENIQVSEDLARMELRQQYEHNWLDARKEFGVAFADRIFPKISGKQTRPKDDKDTSPDKDQ